MQNTKILICDDDDEIVSVLTILLEAEGFTVITENDSTRLFDKIKAVNPDVLIIDIWMPQMSGDEIIRQVRADSELQMLPIIAFSASHKTKVCAMEAGADRYISKPFDIDDISQAITDLLQ